MSIPVYSLRNYDEGLVSYTLNGNLEEITDPEKKRRRLYMIAVSGLKQASGSVNGKVPVFFTIASQAEVFPVYFVPAFVIRRQRFNFAADRLFFPHSIIEPAEGANEVVGEGGIKGYDRYQIYDLFVPVDIQYSIQVIARYQEDANMLLDYLLRRLQYPWSRVLVKDSLGNLSSFEARVDEISSVSELIDVAEKLLGFDVSLSVWGEVLTTGSVVYPSVIQREINVIPKGG